MNYRKFDVLSVQHETEDSAIIRLKPSDDKRFVFKPGQYVNIKNPAFKPEEEHPFSIASSPLSQDYLEFCIKFSGDWTSKLRNLKKNDSLMISQAQGSMVLDEDLTDVVFLIGGLGISPVMSILRSFEIRRSFTNLTLIYGNRTKELVSYKSELEELTHSLHNFRIVNVFSHLDENDPWEGYRGFISKKIIQNEVDLSKKPTFVLVGPTVFLKHTKSILDEFSVSPHNIVTETL